jgi:hypothetical protein
MAKSKSGPQGPVSKGAYDAVSPKKSQVKSYVEGTKTNKSPNIRSAVPSKKSATKTSTNMSVKPRSK